MLQRDTGRPASEWLGITEPATALAFNLAITYELVRFDADAQKTQAKMIAYEVSKIFGTKDEDVSGSPYIDSNTQRW